MNTNAIRVRARALVGVAGLACTLLTGTVAAKDHIVTVALRVSAEGLDLTQPIDAQRFYERLGFARSHVGMTIRF